MRAEKRGRNAGSAVVEITMLIPILMGCIYFYIVAMLFFVQQAKAAGHASDQLYLQEKTSGSSGNIYSSGNMKCIDITVEESKLMIKIEYKRDASDMVKNLRRWQFVADTVQ